MSFDLTLDEDQAAISELFGGFFEKEVGAERVREAEALGFDAVLWASLCRLGAAAMSSGDAASDGVRFSDLIVACEALGRCVAPVPWIEHLSASPMLAEEDVLSGNRIVTLALHPASTEGIWSLVPAGAVAETVIGLDGEELVAVTKDPPRVAPENYGSAPIADRDARAGERSVIGDRAMFDAALDRFRLLTAAALVGIATTAQSLALAYLKERKQFDRMIGSYQALQHGMADFPAHIEGAQLLVHKAAWAMDRGGRGICDVDEGNVRDTSVLTGMAFCYSSDAAAITTDRSLHYHGSYGFSREYEIQLYYRRARAWPQLLSSPAKERARLADLLWPKEADR